MELKRNNEKGNLKRINCSFFLFRYSQNSTEFTLRYTKHDKFCNRFTLYRKNNTPRFSENLINTSNQIRNSRRSMVGNKTSFLR